MRSLPTTLLALAALPSAAAALQPGLYEISMQMVMQGMPVQLPVASFRQCISAQDVADGTAYVSGEKNQDCRTRNLRQSGNTVSYDFACTLPGGQRMIGQSDGASQANGYDVLMRGRFVPALDGVREFSQKLQARRLGNCQ